MREKQEFDLSQFNLDQFDGKGHEKNNSLDDGLDFSTRAQQTTIYSLFGELNLDKMHFGIEKISKMTKSEAIDLIDQLLRMKEDKDASEFDEDFGDYYGAIGEDLKF